MIKIFVGPILKYTPFTTRSDLELLEQQGINVTNLSQADLVISGTFKRILPFMLRYGSRKKYLIWTAEPRYNTFFTPQVKYFLLPPLNVMNVYTGVYTNNYLWTPDRPLSPLTDFPAFRNRKTVALMTYKTGRKCNLKRNGVNIDLMKLRVDIALEGHRRGVLDIYGRGWDKSIALGESRDKDWRLSKPGILQQYHFNLCFENTISPYYCTEKIWDSVQEGCLPIYYGKGSTIYEDFSQGSFLDYCDFGSPDKLFDYIQNMTISEYQERMNLCIKAFNHAIKCKQETNPHQDLVYKTVKKIKEIFSRSV